MWIIGTKQTFFRTGRAAVAGRVPDSAAQPAQGPVAWGRCRSLAAVCSAVTRPWRRFNTACAKPVQQRFYPALLLWFWELHGTWRAHDEWQYPEPGVWQSRSHLWMCHGCRTNDAWVPVLHTVCPWSKQGGLQQLCFVTLCTDTYTHRGLRVDGNLKKKQEEHP